MANPTVRRSVNRDRRSGQTTSQPLPLVTRRFAAWTVEVSMIVVSGLVPFGIGMYANKAEPTGEQVTLNPVVAVTEEAIARTLAQPVDDSNRQVEPVANLSWSIALLAPILLSGWQLYLLAKTGSTLPKRWFGVRVVTATGTVPGISRVLLREGVGAWGLPLSIAYLLWRYGSAFPNVGVLAGLSCLMVLGEGMTARFHRQRRCLHDRLAGTYVVDANRTFTPFPAHLNAVDVQPNRQDTPYGWSKANATTAMIPSGRYASTTIAMQPEFKWQRGWWRWMRQHPSLTLLLVSLASLAAVLGTLVGTQVYIQTQKNQREFEQLKSEQFLALLRQLSADSPATVEERQRAILAMGTLDDPQALQFLVNLLSQEATSGLNGTIQQALVSAGTNALPYLQRLNHSLSNQLEPRRYTDTREGAVRQQQLQATQQAIARILMVYSGKLHTVDLSRTNLGQTSSNSADFRLVLDNINLSGIQLKAANLNQASFQGSRWRGPGEDGHWNTFDDWIADLSDAQMKAANFTGANLSHVLMDRANLIHATLNRANLSRTSLTSANLSSTQMVGADLRDAALANASLTGADLAEANLSRANLSAARLGRVSALGTKLQLANLTASDWQGADLSGADLSRANLSNADLSVTRLTNVDFRNAQMQNANLRNADLRQADLRGANLAGANFQGAIFVSSKPAQPDQFIATPPAETRSALVEGVDFSQAKNLDVKQMAYICTQGGRHPRCP